MDVYGPETRSRVMRSVGSKDTKPEMQVRRLLHAHGFRFRLHREDLPGKPDIVFPGRRKIIFVHGCFWHQHPSCPHAARPSSNSDYWRRKLDRNVQRDAETQVKLAGMGWTTFVVWECQVRDQAELLRRAADFLGSAAAAVSSHE